VVERLLAWLFGYRRLGVRYERRADLLQGLLHLAWALTCLTVLGATQRREAASGANTIAALSSPSHAET
jgi:hypothetical protein